MFRLLHVVATNPANPALRARRALQQSTRQYSAVSLLVVACAGLGVSPPAAAQSEGPAGPGARRLPPVEISATRDPVVKSYRRIIRGVDVFERRRDLAPAVSLRFKLVPRRTDADMQDISLRIVGQTVAIPVAVAADNTFAIERNARALEEDAVVVPNRKAGSLTWRANIRTPGLPPNVRRLGDLRLECLVGIESGLVSTYPPTLFGEIARLIDDWRYCDQREPRYFLFADRPLWSVTLVHGQRRELLPVDRMYAGLSRRALTREELQHCDCEVLLDRTYFAPLGDASWPDDTLLELAYMDDP
jgi:hypothetical protein